MKKLVLQQAWDLHDILYDRIGLNMDIVTIQRAHEAPGKLSMTALHGKLRLGRKLESWQS